MKRIFTYLLLLALLIAIPAQAQVTYDESKNFSRNLVDVLIHLVNSGGTLVVGGAVDVTMNGDLDVVGDIGAGGDITINGDAMFAGGTTGGMELTVAEATAVLAWRND